MEIVERSPIPVSAHSYFTEPMALPKQIDKHKHGKTLGPNINFVKSSYW